jgi:hypothetical protein
MKKELFEKFKDITKELSLISIQELYKKDELFFKHFKNALKKYNIDLKELNQEQRVELNFGTWDNNSEKNGLIPLYIFYLLEDDIKLICPLKNKENQLLLKKEGDDDTRFGCVAYEFYRE